MGSFSFVHWAILLAWFFIVVFPVGKILSRLGFHWALALLTLIPGVNLILLWALAFIAWPKDKAAPAA
ncbi:hypothetical protein [Phenylobacterium sp.]|uniref:hypothetical protein n=1 Tax=Phenylobacterium sp. TaxID=1871053 RepID=UPI0019CF1EE8|nr:hypothetical protein [Phenylobacterium sp.]MBC7166987.1 hypothetical protein [Phenylobacterium sp.]